MLSVIESTLDDPRQVLSAQLFKARGEAVAAMKAEGIEYEERMELLEQVSYPKPLAEPLAEALALYRVTHPWVRDTDLSPKSIVRDMYDWGRTFTGHDEIATWNANENIGVHSRIDRPLAIEPTALSPQSRLRRRRARVRRIAWGTVRRVRRAARLRPGRETVPPRLALRGSYARGPPPSPGW